MEEENIKEMNLFQKLAKIRGITNVVEKNKEGFKYKYTDITEILAKVTAGMKKYHVSLFPTVTPGTAKVVQSVTHNTKVDKTGKAYDNVATEMLFSADAIYRWLNDDNPDEYLDVPWVLVGAQSDPSQAFGSSASYAMRYFLINFFQIATPENDVDAYRSKQKEAEASEDKAVAEEIIKRLDEEVREYIADNQDEAPKVKKLVSKYVKNGEYFRIKEPKLAAKLYEEFESTFKASGENKEGN